MEKKIWEKPVRMPFTEKEKTMRKILIIDDKEGIRTLIREMLKGEGYVVEDTNNGWEALGWIRREDYALILLDVKLPGLNGVDMVKAMQDEGITTGVIIVTAYEEHNTNTDLKNLEIVASFSKPFDIQEVLKKVNQYMDGA
ncbi:response regulator [Salicibibacter halophilus]|uniref:Response regulator n=1 Tax=Salicibibacter halophilus TaxID=2502791 RepID=A0A514LIR9_9BACI|nr:response regulator [Salicibibacter halophilus]QDI91744.1 response regulator [Salicibibacter halophilus]